MGRKPAGDRPMTDVERQRKRRAKVKAAQPGHATVQEFRLALLRFVEDWRRLHEKLTTEDIRLSLEELGLAIRMDEYTLAHPTFTRPDGEVVEFKADWVLNYLNVERFVYEDVCAFPETAKTGAELTQASVARFAIAGRVSLGRAVGEFVRL